MPRKPAISRPAIAERGAVDTAEAVPAQSQEAGKKSARKGSGSLDDLARTALKAFLIARDAAFNVRDIDAALALPSACDVHVDRKTHRTGRSVGSKSGAERGAVRLILRCGVLSRRGT